MALEVINNKIMKLEAYYDTDASAWKALIVGIICEATATKAAYTVSIDMDLSRGTFQADLDALVAEGLVQLKSEESI